MGEAYPGSTGGEIFNCYEGTDRNEASGDYSTTIGSNNKTSGMYSFTGGKNNNNASEYCFIFGQNNRTRRVNVNQYCMVVGRDNSLFNTSAREDIILGQQNTIEKSRQMKIIGDNNYAPNDLYAYSILVGNYNQTTPTLHHPVFTVACGDDSLRRKNGLEIDKTECKILNNLQLATDSTAVNQITAPQDPNNITQDDQTLATKSYVTSVLPATPTDLAKQTTIELATPYTCALNTPIAFTTILNDNTWTFPYPSGSLHLVIEYAGVFMTMVCHVFTTAYSGTQNQPLVWCANINNGANGKLRGIFGQLDQTNWTLTFAQPECVEWDNVADTLTDAMNDSTTLPVIYAITCLNHF